MSRVPPDPRVLLGVNFGMKAYVEGVVSNLSALAEVYKIGAASTTEAAQGAQDCCHSKISRGQGRVFTSRHVPAISVERKP